MLRQHASAVLVRALAAATLIAAGVLSGSGHVAATTPAARPALPSINLGTEPWIGYGPWWIAQKEGFFAREGLTVKIVNFEQDADRNAALASGKTQFSNIDTGRTIQMVENNKLHIRLLLLLDDSEGADAMLAINSIRTLGALRGQRIAYEQGTTSDLLLHYALYKAGIPFGAVHPVFLPAADAGTALIAGRVNVAVTYEPYISNATHGHGGKVHVLYSSAQVPGLIGDYLVGNQAYVQAHPAVVRALLRCWNDAMTYWAAHPAAGTAIMAVGVGSTVADLKSTLAGVKIYSVQQNRALQRSGEIARRYRLVGETLVSQGVVKHPVPASQVVDLSYLPQ
jgi:NitT/TauT family transport system substrate-binding protein